MTLRTFFIAAVATIISGLALSVIALNTPNALITFSAPLFTAGLLVLLESDRAEERKRKRCQRKTIRN